VLKSKQLLQESVKKKQDLQSSELMEEMKITVNKSSIEASNFMEEIPQSSLTHTSQSKDLDGDERVQTADSLEMPKMDGRLLVFKTQRLNRDKKAIESLSIFADFFEDHQMTLSLRVFSKKERKELTALRKDLVYILYGEIGMSAREFRDLCKIYVCQIAWKTDTLEEYIQCLRMVVRAAIERAGLQVKITQRVAGESKLVYTVIQKVQFTNKEGRPPLRI